MSSSHSRIDAQRAEALAHITTIALVQSLKQIERHTRSHRKAILHFEFLAQAIETEIHERAARAAKAFNIPVPCKL